MSTFETKSLKAIVPIGPINIATLLHLHFPENVNIPNNDSYKIYGVKTISDPTFPYTEREFIYQIGEIKSKQNATCWVLERINYLLSSESYKKDRDVADYKIAGTIHMNPPFVDTSSTYKEHYKNSASGNLNLKVNSDFKLISGDDIEIFLYDSGDSIMIEFPYYDPSCPTQIDNFQGYLYIARSEVGETTPKSYPDIPTKRVLYTSFTTTTGYTEADTRTVIDLDKHSNILNSINSIVKTKNISNLKLSKFGAASYTYGGSWRINNKHPYHWSDHIYSYASYTTKDGLAFRPYVVYSYPEYNFKLGPIEYKYKFEIPTLYQQYGIPENYICDGVIVTPPIPETIPETIPVTTPTYGDSSYTRVIDLNPTTYFKYTSGDSYYLNGSDYYGFFNIDVNGKATTGKTQTSDSLVLTPKKTFFAEIHSNKIHLNLVYDNITKLIDYYSNVYDLFNKNELIKITDTINYNNLMIFKQLVIDNYNIYNEDFNVNHYYGFTANENNAGLTISSPKNDYYYIDPYTKNTYWSFLDKISTGTFIVDSDDNFKYVCSSGYDNYLLNGNFTDNTPLTILNKTSLITDDSIDYTYNIHYDKINNRLIYVNTSEINIYEPSNYFDCGVFLLIDRIKLSDQTKEKRIWNITNKQFTLKDKWNTRYYISDNNNHLIKFGNNLRTSVQGNTLILSNKYSSDIIKSIALSSFGIGEVLDLDIREIDDNILILNKKGNDLYVAYLDETLTPIYNGELQSIIRTRPSYKIKFSTLDSDVFYVSNDKEYQTRHITFPHYPTGRLENNTLLYISRYKWSTTTEKYAQIGITWNHGTKKSNEYNNILAIEQENNGKMYTILHNIGRVYTLSQPIIQRYTLNLDDPALVKNFQTIDCSESSIGLFFNNVISDIVKDSLLLFNSSIGKFVFSPDSVTNTPIIDPEISINNFYINGNETFNIIAIKKILVSLRDIQNRILSGLY